jgi:hypothetical protein
MTSALRAKSRIAPGRERSVLIKPRVAKFGTIFDNALSLLRSRTDDRSELEAIPIGWTISLSLAFNPSEARKFFRDDECDPLRQDQMSRE